MPSKKRLDGNCTSFEWRDAAPKRCVLAVGAFEQHSRHLPLATDSLVIRHMAAFVADELDAALLPELPYGTSLEHSGFAGTVSLRPETLMQVIRDIAAELESQGVETLVLLNGHGGNFCLAPVVRDINRRDGLLKIILLKYWEFAPREVLDSPRKGRTDLHAGEFETSVMLALFPKCVGPARVDMPLDGPAWDQGDFNTFGIGFFAPDGSPGYPSLASREKGEKLLAGLKTALSAHLRERLAWLEKDRRYRGAPQSHGGNPATVQDPA